MIKTRVTELFGLDHPIVLAPMAGVSGGALAAAVSNAGGLGLVGGGYGGAEWLRREIDIVAAHATRPWGVGLITWAADRVMLDTVLSYRPAAFMLSFGDPRPLAEHIKAAGCRLICQVQDLAGARLAREAGADLIVAQGTEAGGHGGARASFPLVPAIVDEVGPIPVLAAGGIADGRGLAAALMLGADGVLLGTRFCASTEALTSPNAKERLIAAEGDQTIRTRVFDIVRGYDWPERYTGRALTNAFSTHWHGREAELGAALQSEREAFEAATKAGDCDTAIVWAGEVVDLIHTIETAGMLVQAIAREAEESLRRAQRFLATPQAAVSP